MSPLLVPSSTSTQAVFIVAHMSVTASALSDRSGSLVSSVPLTSLLLSEEEAAQDRVVQSA